MALATASIPQRDFDLREIIRGEEILAPSPSGIHQKTVHNLAKIIDKFLEKNHTGELFLSPLDVILSGDIILQPDLVFLKTENQGILTDWIRGVPDLVVEVVSRHSLTRDTVEKKNIYESFGVSEYWIVFPEQACIEIFTLKDGKYVLHSASDLTDGKVESKLLQGFVADANLVVK